MRAHGHYHKACPYDSIDVYRVIDLFEVTDPCLQHVVKKALVAGGRGHKDIGKDVQDMIDTLTRWQGMRREEVACKKIEFSKGGNMHQQQEVCECK